MRISSIFVRLSCSICWAVDSIFRSCSGGPWVGGPSALAWVRGSPPCPIAKTRLSRSFLSTQPRLEFSPPDAPGNNRPRQVNKQRSDKYLRGVRSGQQGAPHVRLKGVGRSRLRAAGLTPQRPKSRAAPLLALIVTFATLEACRICGQQLLLHVPSPPPQSERSFYTPDKRIPLIQPNVFFFFNLCPS